MIDRLIYTLLQLNQKSSRGTKDKVFLLKEIAYLLAGGVGLVESLQTISDSTDNFAVKSICNTLLADLNSGNSLSKSFNSLYKFFDDNDIAIIRSGENNGNLSNMLRNLAQEHEFIANITSKFVSAMIYPVILLIISIFAVFYLFTNVLPAIFDIMKDFEGAEVPRITQMMIYITQFLTDYGIIIFAIVCITILILMMTYYTPAGSRYIFRILISIPGFGRLIRYYYMIKFYRYMKLMLSSGISQIDTLQSIKQIIGLPAYDMFIDQIIGGLNRGQTIYDNLKLATDYIPADTMVLLKVGEQTANIPGAIDNILSIYESDFLKGLENISKLIEPVLVIIVGGIILLIASSVFGVIGSLMSSVQVQ